MTELIDLRKDLRKFERPESAKVLKRYFKTGPGEYGEGDEFLGLKTDETRSVAKKYLDLPLPDLKKLLASKMPRTALRYAIEKFPKEKRQIYLSKR